MNKKIKVLIVDDSALVRQSLQEIFSSDPEIEVIGTASDPYFAAQKMEEEIPDVITLDVEMPRMDGITFLQKIMSQHPLPVIMCSTLTEKGADVTIRALELGAVDIIQKPRLGTKQFFEESKVLICDTVKAASKVRVKRISVDYKIQPKLSADAVIEKGSSRHIFATTEKIIVVGASTGGTEALRVFLEALPIDVFGIVVVQHMPKGFTTAFAERLNQICSITVMEAEDGATILRGQALIAPGDIHLLIKRSGAKYYVELKDGPLVSRHRPSVDVLFRSAARYAGKNCMGIIMTGMGDDGAKGMLELKEAGAYTVAQDEASCVVFGMPKVAIEMGGVDKILPLKDISKEVIKYSFQSK